VAAVQAALSPTSVVGRVVETAQLSPGLVRVLLDVPDLARLELPDAPDAAVGIYFAASEFGQSGRTYTVRHHDAQHNRITVDFVMHGRATGTDWVMRANHGDAVTLAYARSWYRPPAATGWQLLVADMAGLPALARLIDQARPDRAVAIVEVHDSSDLTYLPEQSVIPVVASLGTGNGLTAGALAPMVAQHCRSAGRGYCWFAGEAGQARAVRKYLRHDRGWESDQLDVMGYWRHDSEKWDARYATVGPRLFSIYQRARAGGKSEKAAAEEFDEALERAGL
jgi:NADPH-dependent ferric siderophore reductase